MMVHAQRDAPAEDYQRQRIALAVFNDITKLRETINALTAIGLPAYELVIVAEQGAVKGKLESFLKTGPKDLPSLLIRNADDVVAYAGEPARSGILADMSAHQLALFEIWATPELAEGLDHYLNSGACILIAPVINISMERPITEILLNVSISSVQLHDIQTVSGA